MRKQPRNGKIVGDDHGGEPLVGDEAAHGRQFEREREGRQCARLSAQAYAFERNFWYGEGGWSSRFGHRAPPPLPAFDAACRALRDGDEQAAASAGLEAARTEALHAAANAVALVTAKLRAAALELRLPRG